MNVIAWNRSNDGHTSSKCGRFQISANYWGCSEAQDYALEFEGMIINRMIDTQKEAKKLASEFLAKRETGEK